MSYRRLLQIKPFFRQEVVEGKIKVLFPDQDPASILSLLDECGDLERERVQLAILKLSNGNLEQLHHYLRIAKDDYRGVLTPAESPGMSESWSRSLDDWNNLSKTEREHVEDEDLQQYLNWLQEQ